jgi:hypothetical protein
MLHHHRDVSPQMRFVKPERLLAVAAIVQVGVKLHDCPPSSGPPRDPRSLKRETKQRTLK